MQLKVHFYAHFTDLYLEWLYLLPEATLEIQLFALFDEETLTKYN